MGFNRQLKRFLMKKMLINNIVHFTLTKAFEC